MRAGAGQRLIGRMHAVRMAIPLALGLALAGCIPTSRIPPPQAESSGQSGNGAGPQSPRIEPDMGAILSEPGAPTIGTPAAVVVVPNATTVPNGRYIVQPGDTLRGIGNRTGVGSEALARANGLMPPYVIQPGQQLRVPGGLYHLVRAGETGIAIARAYAAPWSEIVALNGLEAPYILRIGQRLMLPQSERGQTLEERAAAFALDIGDAETGSQGAVAEGTRPAPPVVAAGRGSGISGPIAEPTSFSGRFAWPLKGSILARFGPLGGGKVNSGLDIAAPRGTPVRASAEGVVSYAGDEIAVYGGLILITHGNGWVSAYGHLDRIDVVRGQKVAAGTIIGLSGATGQVQTPQLHFELRRNRQPVDPATQLPRP